MAATELHALNVEPSRGRPGLLATILASLAIQSSAPLVDSSSEAALSQPVVPRHVRMSMAWWRSRREDKLARRAVRRLAETSPHLLRDIGLPDVGRTDAGFERHHYGIHDHPR